MVPVDETQIRERREAVVDLIARHELALSYLKQELNELDVAVRVCERFHDRPDFADLLPLATDTTDGEQRKPTGIPTMADMILAVLQNAEAANEGPLEPKDIVARIRQRWWPDAPNSSVGPTAWRMWKDKRLDKTGAAYSTPKDEAPGGASPGASAEERPFGELLE